jgi:hypothetical protein
MPARTGPILLSGGDTAFREGESFAVRESFRSRSLERVAAWRIPIAKRSIGLPHFSGAKLASPSQRPSAR